MSKKKKRKKGERVLELVQVGPGDAYVLTIGDFDSSNSTLGDAMAHHKGMKFSAK